MDSAKKHVVLAITLGEPGGAQGFVLGFAKWLNANGYQVTVVAGNGRWLYEKCVEAHIAIRRVPHLGRAIHPWNDLRAFFALKKILRELKPDTLHLNSAKMGVLGSLAASALGIRPVVYRIGGWTFLEPLSPLIKRLYLFAEQRTARYKDTIICVHPEDEALAKEKNITPRKNLVTIPNGIDLDAFDRALLPRDTARTALHLSDTDIVFGTIAHLYPAKDLPRYIEACAAVAKVLPQAKFVILGDGPERISIERTRSRLGLVDRVLLAGATENASRLLRAFDAFVLPSAKEGMSWALLEAMACGIPCLATDVGANRWLLGEDAGWIVPPHDPRALADAMLRAIHHTDEAQTRSLHARTIVKQRFPLKKTYEDNAHTLI